MPTHFWNHISFIYCEQKVEIQSKLPRNQGRVLRRREITFVSLVCKSSFIILQYAHLEKPSLKSVDKIWTKQHKILFLSFSIWRYAKNIFWKKRKCNDYITYKYNFYILAVSVFFAVILFAARRNELFFGKAYTLHFAYGFTIFGMLAAATAGLFFVLELRKIKWKFRTFNFFQSHGFYSQLLLLIHILHLNEKNTFIYSVYVIKMILFNVFVPSQMRLEDCLCTKLY